MEILFRRYSREKTGNILGKSTAAQLVIFVHAYSVYKRSRHSSVGTATTLLDERCIIVRVSSRARDPIFSTGFRLCAKPIRPSIYGVLGAVSPRITPPGSKAEKFLSSSISINCKMLCLWPDAIKIWYLMKN